MGLRGDGGRDEQTSDGCLQRKHMFDFTSAAATKLTYVKADMLTAGKPSPSTSTASFMQTLWSQTDRLQLSFGRFGPQNQELRIPLASFRHIWRTELVSLCSPDTILHVKKHPNRCADQRSLFRQELRTRAGS